MKSTKVAAFKNLDEKSCEIKGGGHEMVAIMLMIINLFHNLFIQVILRPHLFIQLSCFAWIITYFKNNHLFCKSFRALGQKTTLHETAARIIDRQEYVLLYVVFFAK